MQLELELDDRTVDADVPPLEAAFIELFSEKGATPFADCLDALTIAVIDTWTVDELISRVGTVNRIAALKSLATWVDMRVLREESENVFKLLSVAEQSSPGTKSAIPKQGTFSSTILPSPADT